jgi:hypothetical protein
MDPAIVRRCLLSPIACEDSSIVSNNQLPSPGSSLYKSSGRHKSSRVASEEFVSNRLSGVRMKLSAMESKLKAENRRMDYLAVINRCSSWGASYKVDSMMWKISRTILNAVGAPKDRPINTEHRGIIVFGVWNFRCQFKISVWIMHPILSTSTILLGAESSLILQQSRVRVPEVIDVGSGEKSGLKIVSKSSSSTVMGRIALAYVEDVIHESLLVRDLIFVNLCGCGLFATVSVPSGETITGPIVSSGIDTLFAQSTRTMSAPGQSVNIHNVGTGKALSSSGKITIGQDGLLRYCGTGLGVFEAFRSVRQCVHECMQNPVSLLTVADNIKVLAP